MVPGRRKFGVLLLAVAGIMFSLMLLSTTSSGAQTGAEDRAGGAVAGAGSDECVDFKNQDGNTKQSRQQNGNEDSSTQQYQDESGADQQTQQNGDGQQALQNEQNTGNQQTLQNGNNEGDATDQQTQNGDQQVQGQNENGGVQQSQGNGDDGDEQAQQDEGDATSSRGAEENEDDECVIADTVPDGSLPPTGAPGKSRAKETTAEKKSDRSEKPESRKTKKKSNSSETQKTNGSEAQKKSNSSEGRQKINSNEAQRESDRGETLEYRGEKIENRSGKEPRQEELKSSSESAAASDLAPVLAANWPRPSREEVTSTDKPRRFAPDPGTEMTLSARALGLYNVPVASSGRREELDKGLIRVPETSRPGDGGDNQGNVYIAGHYLGLPGTPSRMAFYNLHELESGDELVLKDGLGRSHEYQVSEKFAVGPGDNWAMGQVRDRDMVTLQTCIPPDFGKRLVVRADRV